PRAPPPFPTRRSSDLGGYGRLARRLPAGLLRAGPLFRFRLLGGPLGHEGRLGERPLLGLRLLGRPLGHEGGLGDRALARLGIERSEEHTSELQSPCNL